MPAFNATEAVNVGGKDYTLAIDIATIDEIEDDFDMAFDQIMAKVGAGSVRIGKMARLVKGLLSRHHPDVTLDEVGSLMFEHGDAFGGGIERLFSKAWPKLTEQEAKGKNPPKPRRGTGARS